MADIEDFVDHWGQSILGDLGNGVQSASEHVGRLFKVSKKKLSAEKAIKK